MKIALLSPAHPLRGGIAASSERLSVELVKMGHDLTIYSFSLQYPSFLFPGKTQFTDSPASEGLVIKTVINSVNPLNWISVGRQLKKEKYDLIIVRFWMPFMGPSLGTILKIAKGDKHTKVVCIADNIIPHDKKPGDKQLTQYFVKPIDAFVTMSRDVLKDVRLFSQKPAFFSPHPIYDIYGHGVSKEAACKRLNLDPSKKYLLFFGFIRAYKGLDWLLEAMADERIKQAGIELIVGGEYYDKKFEADNNQIIAAHQLEQSVHLFTRFIPDSEVKDFFSAADLVVQPYKHATQSGITQIAYHFEKPMIVTNVGGLAEVVPDGKVGFVAEPNPGSIADAILKFFEPSSILNLNENILVEKKKYDWDILVHSILAAAFGDNK